MAQISMQLVKELRDRTQAGLNDCKSALQEADGDIEKAIEVILKKGLAKSAKRAGALAAEGEVVARVSDDQRSGVIVEVNIQTDFAARNDDFKQFVQDVVQVAASADSGVELGALPWPGGDGTIEDRRQALVGKLGENINVRRWQRLDVAANGRVHSYVHLGGRVGVLLAVELGDAAAVASPALAEFLDNTAMQAAAMAPQYLSVAEVPEADKDKQRAIFLGQVEEMDKPPPEAARAKIVEGKLVKWMKEVVLLEQASVLETEKSVDQLRAEVAKALGTEVNVVGMVRYLLGEGIERQEGKSFADEVAAMAATKQ